MACLHSRGMYRTAGLIVFLITAPLAAEEAPPRLTLDRASEEAVARSPVLRAGRAEFEQAQARLLTAKTYPFNPEIAIEGIRRRSDGDTTTDRDISVAQEVEIGGQRRRRVEEASASLKAARADLLRQERLLLAGVRAVFVETLRVRELLAVEKANTDLAQSLAAVATKRFEAGAVPQMEVNLAMVQVGRAERDLQLAQGDYEIARTVLAETIGLDPAKPPEPEGDLETPGRPLPSLEELLEAAFKQRADLQAFRNTVEAARARIQLARRDVIPNLTIAALYGREEGTDRLTGGQISIRIPLFNRNQGAIREARAAHRQAAAATQAAELQVRQEVAAAVARYRAASEARMNLKQKVLGSLRENLDLLQRSFESGKISWTQVLVFRREFVDVQRDYLETVTSARLARIELDLAAGSIPTISTEEPQP